MKSTTAADIMSTPVVTVHPDQKIIEVVRLLLRWHISGAPVVDEKGDVVGIISEHDITNTALDGYAHDTKAGDVMTKEVISLSPDVEMEEVSNCLSRNRLRRVPIVKDGKVVGIISRRDILREMLRLYGSQ